jgi:hypothetical protein
LTSFADEVKVRNGGVLPPAADIGLGISIFFLDLAIFGIVHSSMIINETESDFLVLSPKAHVYVLLGYYISHHVSSILFAVHEGPLCKLLMVVIDQSDVGGQVLTSSVAAAVDASLRFNWCKLLRRELYCSLEAEAVSYCHSERCGLPTSSKLRNSSYQNKR